MLLSVAASFADATAAWVAVALWNFVQCASLRIHVHSGLPSHPNNPQSPVVLFLKTDVARTNGFQMLLKSDVAKTIVFLCFFLVNIFTFSAGQKW